MTIWLWLLAIYAVVITALCGWAFYHGAGWMRLAIKWQGIAVKRTESSIVVKQDNRRLRNAVSQNTDLMNEATAEIRRLAGLLVESRRALIVQVLKREGSPWAKVD